MQLQAYHAEQLAEHSGQAGCYGPEYQVAAELFLLQNRVHPARSHLAVLLWQTCQILLIEYQREGYQPTALVCPDSPSGA